MRCNCGKRIYEMWFVFQEMGYCSEKCYETTNAKNESGLAEKVRRSQCGQEGKQES
jgi:hypothetical protein